MLTLALSACPQVNNTELTSSIVTISEIKGVAAPILGETPALIITETDQYTGTVSWNHKTSTFEESTEYIAVITLAAKSGYTITGVTKDFFKVAGAITVSNTADSGVVVAVFPETSTITDSVVTLSDISGVAAPVLGETPISTITETEQYTGTIRWSHDVSTFEESTEYTAVITLAAKSGYTITGVTEDFFNVAGAMTVSNTADSGVVMAVFPKTAKRYAIGEIGPSLAGLVFYITDGGLHGYEVALEDQATEVAWSNITVGYVNGSSALSQDLGSGSANTDAIINQSGHTASAAQICRDYRSEIEGDWFLPTLGELEKVRRNLVANLDNEFTNTGNFDKQCYYWTSTESIYKDSHALTFVFNQGSGIADLKSNGDCNVRAIRAF